MQKSRETDVLVVGAGPSGTVAASILKQKGHKVEVIEKSTFPRFVIGESLLPRCMDNLVKADFIEDIKAAGFQKKFGAKFVKDTEVCDFNFANQHSDGWKWTWQVQRAKFDKVLADKVEKMGVPVHYGSGLESIEFSPDGSSISKVASAEGNYKIQAKYVVDASGYGRVLPRLLNLDKPVISPERGAVFCHLEENPKWMGNPDRNLITAVVHTEGIWVWIIPFNDATTSVGIVAEPHLLKMDAFDSNALFDHWLNEIPALSDRFKNSKKIFEPRVIRAFSKSVKELYGKGFVLTGNSSEFVDPIFSSGVTFATESGALSAELIDRELRGESVNWKTEYHDYIHKGVDVFRTFVNAWYDGSLHKIFFNAGTNENMKQQICSVLAGYVWDASNPFVTKHERALNVLAHFIE